MTGFSTISRSAPDVPIEHAATPGRTAPTPRLASGPSPAPSTTGSASAQRSSAAEALPVVLGAGDGPLANLGVGAVRPGVAACSIGTSGALRLMVEKPVIDERGRVFCYALT